MTLSRYKTLAPIIVVITLWPLLLGLQSFTELYSQAKADYLALKRSDFRQAMPQEWDRVIGEFRAILDGRPPAHIAEVTTFTLGQVYYDKARRLKDPASLNGALHYFHQVTKLFPAGPLADNAQLLSGDIYFFELKDYPRAYESYRYVEKVFPQGDMINVAHIRLRELQKVYSAPEPSANSLQAARKEGGENGQTVVERVRHWSNRAYTRVVVDLSGPIEYRKQRIGNPDRLYIDLQPARLSSELTSKSIPVEDGLLKRVRFAQNQADVVRVVLDIESLKDFKIFTLSHPNRLTIDVHGDPASSQAALKDVVIWGEGGYASGPRPIRTIVIDPGHGGKDPGAVGPMGLKEKDVNLDIALRLARMLGSAGVRVVLTRDRDVFVPLEERTAIANINNADLFISIHANASRYRGARGIETYFLNATQDQHILKVAARENNIPVSQMTVLEKILFDLDATDNASRSIPLATTVQENLVDSMGSRHKPVNDLGAKPGPFYVLVGAKMPAVLIETAFISNPKEEAKLRSPAYKQRVAEAIFQGIDQYARQYRVALQAQR